MTIEDRFWKKVDKTKKCWVWNGAKNPDGYGLAWTGKKLVAAHRFAYEAIRGPIISSLQIDHLCRNRACVNPYHMEVVTQQENIRRGNVGKKQRDTTHCPSGHPYEGANVVYYKRRRSCRACHALSCKNYRTKKLASRVREVTPA